MLQVTDLGVNRGECPVLRNIALALQSGEVLGVLGPNGAGKSTLLAALSGELPASRGQILLSGTPLQAWAPLPGPGSWRCCRRARRWGLPSAWMRWWAWGACRMPAAEQWMRRSSRPRWRQPISGIWPGEAI